MNLKLKRLVRTPSSEQYALYDLDQHNNSSEPLSIGKLDLHYTDAGLYGTLLIWQPIAQNLSTSQRRTFVEALLLEITQPMGVPTEYAVEFFTPELSEYELFHNVAESDPSG